MYVKARGPAATSPYEDFDLRYLFIRSLYQPAWGAWVDTREANENLPNTFEGLVDALKKAEATRIMRSPSPIDPMMHTAHATAVGNRSPSPASPAPAQCKACGGYFCPKKPQHIRCDKY